MCRNLRKNGAHSGRGLATVKRGWVAYRDVTPFERGLRPVSLEKSTLAVDLVVSGRASRYIHEMSEPTQTEEPVPDFRGPFRPQASVGTVVLGIYYSLICIGSFGSVAVMSAFGLADATSHGINAWMVAQFLCALAGITAPIAVIVNVVMGVKKRAAMEALRSSYALLVLAVMPLWGMFLNHSLKATCVLDGCEGDSTGEVRSLAEPGVQVLMLVQLLVAIAYVVSRRRPEALHPRAEPWIHATLLAGIIMHVLIGVHFGPDILVGTMFFPIGGGVLSPILNVILLTTELRERLRRRGAEAAQPAPVKVTDPFRGGDAEHHAAPARPRVHGKLLAVSVAHVPVIAGVYALVAALVHDNRYGAIAAFTQTCSHTFSRIPLEHMPRGDCHYLCTVAARGHTWLARPERMGVRRGVPIVVNRQLAIANAFEDLLHERWPRFGAFARRVYDKLGYPVSQYITRPWMADVVLILMKPAEYMFFVFLLIVDKRSPEARIDRMYRP